MDQEQPKTGKPEEPKVKVSDRRRFTAEGETRDPSEIDAAPQGTASAAAAPGVGGPTAASPEAQSSAEPAPDVQGSPRPGVPAASFELLVLSLAMQAQMELGLGEPHEEHAPDLDVARHTIDLLAVLQQKTKGNLTHEEQRLLDNTVTELRFRYVQALEQINRRAKS
jgi:hypothetical protein